jgi:hypothetical protein
MPRSARKVTQPAAPAGALLRPVGRLSDGTAVSVADRVAEAMRLGGTLHDGAVRAGVSPQRLAAWVRSGNRIAAALDAGSLLHSDLDAQARAEVALAQTVEASATEGKLLLLGLLERLSRGTEVRTVTVRLDASGREVDRYERTEQHAPDAATIRWRLERRWPDEWAPKGRLEVTGPDGGPLSVDLASRAAELAEALRATPPPPVAATNGAAGNGHSEAPTP